MQRPPACPCCGHNFGAKDGGQVGPRGSRLPLLLQCGHTVCEGCLHKMIRAQASNITCPVCQVSISLKEGGVASLTVDTYILGLITLSKRSTMDRLKSTINFQMPDTNSSNTVKKKEPKIPKREVCVECATKAAACRCDKCETVLCTTCFEKVHRSSKTLRLHQSLPLHDSSACGVPTICTKHANRPIEYFCEDDQTPICSHCVIMGDHQGHGITAMEVINKRALSGLEPAVELASMVLMRMKNSDKMMSAVVPNVKSELQQVVDDITSHFKCAHGLLQARETALLEELLKKYQLEGSPLEQLKTQLQSDVWNLDQSIKEAKQLLKEGNHLATTCTNAQGLLSKLEKSTSLPCFAMKMEIEGTNSLNCSFSPDFTTVVKDYGKLAGELQVGITIKPYNEVPTELLGVDPVDSAPQSGGTSVISDALSVITDNGTVDTEMDTDSVSAQSAFSDLTTTTSRPSGHKTKPMKKSRTVSPELVYMTHLKHPCHFLVQKCSDFTRLKQLQKNINKHCSNPDTVNDIPVDITIGDYVLSQFQGTWYRARVTQVLSDSDEPNPNQIKLIVFYIDYGNTETVILSNLRDMKSRFMKMPELVKTCSLVDIVPVNEAAQWSQEAVKAFARMTADKPMQMLLKSEEDNMLYVDLSKPGCDDIEDDRPISVRDMLVFLEMACFRSPYSAPTTPGGPVLKPQKQYFRPSIPYKGASVLCMVSFVESPQKFFIQQISEDAQYMHEMMINIQHTYTQDTKDLYTIFCPQKDMVCAAHYSHDDAWYRAQVIELPGRSEVKVRYVDYGNEEYISNWKLQKLLDKYMVLPIQAICCELADVCPVNKETGWTQENVLKFAGEVTTKKMIIEVKQVRPDMTVEVVLMEQLEPEDVGLMEPVCYNRWLVDQGDALSTGPSSEPLPMDTRQNVVTGTSLSDHTSEFPLPSYPAGPRLTSQSAVIGSLNEPIAPGSAPRSVPQTTEEGTVGTVGKPTTMEVMVSHIVSPGHMYMHLATQNDDRLRLMSDLKRHMETMSPVSVTMIEPGASCAVRYPDDGQWYRAEIISLQPDEQKAQVQLVDYGFETTLPVTEIFWLPDKFSLQRRFSFLCHLSDLQPAGDPTRWSRTSIELLTDTLKDQVCYIQTKDNNYEDGKVGVDLLMEEHIKGDALTGDQLVYTSIRDIMLDKGLALPKSKIRKILPKDQKKKEMAITTTTPPVSVTACSAAPLVVQSTKEAPELAACDSTTTKRTSETIGSVVENVVEMIIPQDVGTDKTTFNQTTTEPSCSLSSEDSSLVLTSDQTQPTAEAGPSTVSCEQSSSVEAITKSVSESIGVSPELSTKHGSCENSGKISRSSSVSEALDVAYRSSVDAAPESSLTNESSSSPITNPENKIISEATESSNSLHLEIETDARDKETVTENDSENKEQKETATPSIAEPKEQIAPAPPDELQNYKLPDMLHVFTMSVVPTYVDYDCHVFLQPVKPDSDPEGRLGFVLKENTIEVKLQNSYFEKMELYRAKIIRDGNCLFRACAQAILADQNKYKEVRESVTDTLHEYWWLFENILGGLKKDSYIADMSRDGTYGGEPEIQAICFAYQVQINLYMGGLASPIMCRSYGNSGSPQVQLSYVSDGHFDCGHYDLIVDTMAATESSEVLYAKWRVKKIEDYQMSHRLTDNNLYENSILDQLMAYLQSKYTGSPPQSTEPWAVGQAIVAQYGDDNLFYRARIIDILDLGYKVKYVDFGNEEVLPVARLRSQIALPDIPVQCYECIVNQLLPDATDGKWSVPVLNKVHEYTVGKTFVMHVKDVLSGNKLVVDLENSAGESIAYKLCELGLSILGGLTFDLEDDPGMEPILSMSQLDTATTVETAPDPMDTNVSVDFITLYGIPKQRVESPYPQQVQLKMNDCVPCSVTQVDCPNVIYLQRIKQEDLGDLQVLGINEQLDQLLKILDVLNTDYLHYKKLDDIRPGVACCAQYSVDQGLYRAEILSVGHGPNKDLCGVLFVDYGSSEYISVDSLLELPKDLINLPVQAVRCSLAGIHSVDGADTWDPTVTLDMTQVLASQEIIAVVKSCTDDIEVALYPRDQFYAIGVEAPLAYHDLIVSGVIQHSEFITDPDSEAIIEETYEEDVLSDDQASPHVSQSWADMMEGDKET